MTDTEDVIQLHPDLKSEWDAIVAHYQRVGLTPSTNAVWDVTLERSQEYPEHQLSVFYFGDALHHNSLNTQYFQQLDKHRHQVVEFMNSKNNFMQIAHELGVKVPQTFCCQNTAEIPEEVPYPCYLKPSVSVDGVGIVRCETEAQLDQALQHLAPESSFQIQEEVVATTFLNLQYHVTEQGVEPLAASEQILDGCSHGGNRYPTPYQPWELVEPMAQWLAEQGMKDVFAFDVAVETERSDPHYLAIECNPRFNGATYPTGIARKLDITHWSCETFRTQHHSLDAVDLSGIEFDSATGTGVILVNWGPIQVGKLVILLAGSPEQQQQLRQTLKVRLG